MIHGENLILAINGTPLAASKSCNLSKSSSFIEVSSPTEGDWEAFEPSKKGWSMNSDCLLGTMDAYKTLDAAWKAGTALTIRFFNTEYDENETGTAYIDSLNLDASKGNLAKMSVSLKGSGPLSEYAGAAITVGRTLRQTGKYYIKDGGTFIIDNYSDSAKIYSGSFSLSKRTLVQISYATSGNNSYVLLSQSNSIVTKATNADSISSSDYSSVIVRSGKVWLDAGEWYIVESSKVYETPTYKALSI